VLALVTSAAFGFLVMPFTDRAQIEQVATALENRDLLNIHGSDVAGSVLKGLYAKGGIFDVSRFVNRIREPNAVPFHQRSRRSCRLDRFAPGRAPGRTT
jgi:hypothetical protein